MRSYSFYLLSIFVLFVSPSYESKNVSKKSSPKAEPIGYQVTHKALPPPEFTNSAASASVSVFHAHGNYIPLKEYIYLHFYKNVARMEDKLFHGIVSFLRRCFIQVLSYGPMPRHIAFILDGNRRYGKKWNLKDGEIYQRGFYNVMSILRYCYEMGVEHVTLYAFSIDNFKRKPKEVQLLMDLIKEKIDKIIKDINTLNNLDVRIKFIGKLTLLDDYIRKAAEKVMAMTAKNKRLVVSVCLCYTSTEEIMHGVEGACEEAKNNKGEEKIANGNGLITVGDLEQKMYFVNHPAPNMLIRTSGETRLSNFLLWQTAFCVLYAPRCLWPELTFWHLVWAVLLYQRKFAYLEKIKKRM